MGGTRNENGAGYVGFTTAPIFGREPRVADLLIGHEHLFVDSD